MSAPTLRERQFAWISARYTVKQLIEECRRVSLPTRSGTKEEILGSLLAIGWNPPGFDPADPFPRTVLTRPTLPPRS